MPFHKHEGDLYCTVCDKLLDEHQTKYCSADCQHLVWDNTKKQGDVERARRKYRELQVGKDAMASFLGGSL